MYTKKLPERFLHSVFTPVLLPWDDREREGLYISLKHRKMCNCTESHMEVKPMLTSQFAILITLNTGLKHNGYTSKHEIFQIMSKKSVISNLYLFLVVTSSYH